MPTIADIRAKFPQYNDLSDDDLEDKIHKKFYPDMPRAEFYNKLSVNGVAGEIKKGQTVTGTAPVSGELAYRSPIFPVGKTQEGNIVPAIPGAITETAAAVRQFIDAGSSGPPGSREVTQGAIAPSTELAAAFAPATPAAVEAGSIVKGLIGGKSPAKMTTEDLHSAGSAAYKTAENAGVAIKPDAFVGMVSDIAKEVKQAGFDKDIQPKAAAALRRLAQEAAARKPTTEVQAITKIVEGKRVVSGMKNVEHPATPVALSDFDIIRQVAQSAAKSNEANERRIAGIIKGGMDDFLAAATERDFVGGDAKTAVGALTEARPLWARYAKSDQIDQLFENASLKEGGYSAAGYESALRNEFKTLATNRNRMRKFSPDEQDAIRAVAKTGKLQSALVKLGKFSPTAGFFAGILSGEILLKSAANPKLLAIPAVGGIARWAATKIREGQAENVRRVVSGGKETAEFMKQRKAGRKTAVSDIVRKAQRPALFGGSSALSDHSQ